MNIIRKLLGLSPKPPAINPKALQDAWLVGDAPIESFTNDELITCKEFNFPFYHPDLTFHIAIEDKLLRRRNTITVTVNPSDLPYHK